MRNSRPGAGPDGGRPGAGAPSSPTTGAVWRVVFVHRNGQPTPVWIRTGLTDLDLTEVVEGLTEEDTIVLLTARPLG